MNTGTGFRSLYGIALAALGDTQIESSRHLNLEVAINVLPWTHTQRQRQAESLVSQAHGGWFPFERRLLLGLPPSVDWDHHERWLFHEQWDYLAYVQSLTRAPGFPNSAFFVNPDNATKQMGLNSLGAGRFTRQQCRARIDRLLPSLEELGFINKLGDYRAEGWKKSLPVYQHMLMPTLTAAGLVKSALPRTIENLTAQGRPYVMVPRHVMRAENGVFRILERHEMRRLFLALYAFNDLPRFGGVDPNHLRVEDHARESLLLVSDAFLAASGLDVDHIKGCLNEIVGRWNRRPAVASLPEVYATSEMTSDGTKRYRYLADCASFDEGVSQMMRMLSLPHLRPDRIRVFRPVHQVSLQVDQFNRLNQGRIDDVTN